MRVTKDVLMERRACREGVEAFTAHFPQGFDGEWTQLQQLNLLYSPLRRWLGWAWREGIVPMWTMAGIDLQGANLWEADLQGAYLRGANLQGADLRGAVK